MGLLVTVVFDDVYIQQCGQIIIYLQVLDKPGAERRLCE